MCVCYISVARNDPSECVFVSVLLMFAYLLHELLCVCALTASPSGSHVDPVNLSFTYHFTELYVQSKQRLSLHANELVGRRLHKEPIHSHVVSQQHFESDTPDYKFIPGLRVQLHCHSLFTSIDSSIIGVMTN